MVFFTDGQPTIGETNPDKILKNVLTPGANTRISPSASATTSTRRCSTCFRNGRGRVSTYVRPARTSKSRSAPCTARSAIPAGELEAVRRRRHQPGGDVPAATPDLFHGGQARRHGPLHRQRHVALKLTGSRQGTEGVRLRDQLPDKTGDDRSLSNTSGRGARSATSSTKSAPTAKRKSS